MKYLTMTAYCLAIFIVATFLIAFFSYFNLFNGTFLMIIKFIVPLLIVFISSIKLGKTSSKNGFAVGLINGAILVALFLFCNLIFFRQGFPLMTWLYYGLLLLVAMGGGMLGINKKKDA